VVRWLLVVERFGELKNLVLVYEMVFEGIEEREGILGQ